MELMSNTSKRTGVQRMIVISQQRFPGQHVLAALPVQAYSLSLAKDTCSSFDGALLSRPEALDGFRSDESRILRSANRRSETVWERHRDILIKIGFEVQSPRTQQLLPNTRLPTRHSDPKCFTAKSASNASLAQVKAYSMARPCVNLTFFDPAAVPLQLTTVVRCLLPMPYF